MTTAGLLGMEWASFMLGTPANSITVAKNDSYYLTNPYYSFYIQDDWRVSQKLTINMGLRFEREAGFSERYNRAVMGFDPNSDLPIRADFINALNNVHYQGPNTDITSSNFGKITAQNNIPRWIQFQLRFTF